MSPLPTYIDLSDALRSGVLSNYLGEVLDEGDLTDLRDGISLQTWESFDEL